MIPPREPERTTVGAILFVGGCALLAATACIAMTLRLAWLGDEVRAMRATIGACR